MLEDIVSIIESFPELNEIARRRSTSVKRLILSAVRKWDKEFVPADAKSSDLLDIGEHPRRISHEDAVVLYKRLSKYFAKKGMEQTEPVVRKANSAKAAGARWPQKRAR